MGEIFQRHRQAWTSDEIQKLHRLAAKGMSLRAIAKAMTRSEESVQARGPAGAATSSAVRARKCLSRRLVMAKLRGD